MVSINQSSSMSDNDQQRSDETDSDIEQNTETLSSYQMTSAKCQAIITVRQIRSKGLSFQLWPVANALCWYVEHKFGDEGMQTPECSLLLANDAASSDRFAPVLGMGSGLVDNFQSNRAHDEEEFVETSQVRVIEPVERSNRQRTWKKMRVLELGSGTGMVGIVAACLGAHVVLTDLPHVIPNISHNLELNRAVIEAAGGSVEAMVLRWGVADDVTALGHLAFDLILASDCVYHVPSFKPLLETLKLLTARDRVVASNSDVEALAESQSHDKEIGSKVSPDSQTDAPNERKGALNIPESRAGEANRECVILLGHLRRWKKDSQFFSMASKCFDVQVAHRHPSDPNARIGPIIYLLSFKSKQKLHRRFSSSSMENSCIDSPSCSMENSSIDSPK